MTKFIQLVGALLGTLLGFGLGLLILTNADSVIDAPNRPAFLMAMVAATLLFGYLAIPYVTTRPARWAVDRLAHAGAGEFALGVAAIVVGLLVGVLAGLPLIAIGGVVGSVGPPVVAVILALLLLWATMYKRDVLLQYGESLGRRLEAESVMQWELQSQGHRFAIEPRAIVRHENFAQLGPSIRLRFHGGRLFAARRAQAWTPGRRVAFALASPLIPLVRWWRSVPMATRANGGTPPWRIWPVLALLLACDGAGECVGYLAGTGSAVRRSSELEFHRYRFHSAQQPAEPSRAS